MASESARIKCVNENCSNTILPATARANNGLCAPCVGEKNRLEQERYIKANRRSVDPYAGLSNVADIISVLHTQRKYDPLLQYAPAPRSIEELYSELSQADAARLMCIAAEALRAGNEHYAEQIAEGLAVLTDYSLDEMLAAWVDKCHFRPAVIFRRAGPRVRDAVIGLLENDHADANWALEALAWIGDPVVQKQFLLWDSEPPPWRRRIFIKTSQYSTVAGWELVDARRRDLFFPECFALLPNTSAPVQSAKAMVPVDQNCPWCKHHLVHLLELDLSDSRFHFLPAVHSKLAVLTCESCTCYTTIFAENAGPSPTWSPRNATPQFLPLNEPFPSPWRDQPVSLRPRRAIEAADWCMDLTISQVGGMPSWVQDSAFPQCPSCNETMHAIGQIDNGAFPGYEGVYYAFLCARCRITATSYQQT